MEEKKQRGGKREGAGRKSVADEAKANAIFTTALKKLYQTDSDEEAKENFVNKVLMESQRGQLFIAEHIFGKPKETVDQTLTLNNFSLKDVINFDNSKQ